MSMRWQAVCEMRRSVHIPRRQRGLGDEYTLAKRLGNAKSKRRLSESQLAELAEIAGPALSRYENGHACWATSGHDWRVMLVLLSLVSIDVRLGDTNRWRAAASGVSSEVRWAQCFSACADLI